MQSGNEFSILAVDVGGTNTNFALIRYADKKLELISKYHYHSKTINNFYDPLVEVQTSISSAHPPCCCCISAAGPVKANICRLTNLDWSIDSTKVSALLDIPCLLINDFQALSFGTGLLDTSNPDEIYPVYQPSAALSNADQPPPAAANNTLPYATNVRAVVGAGTGLGVGVLIRTGKRYIAVPSEGGHADIAPFNQESRELREYLLQNETAILGAEDFVSGRGILNMYHFYRDVKIPRGAAPLPGEISTIPANEIPQFISTHASSQLSCRAILDLFIQWYAHFAGTVASFFLPTEGLYLAGGIATKNEAFFRNTDNFAPYYIQNHAEKIRTLIKKIPVYIVKDYYTSLYGAAFAALNTYSQIPAEGVKICR